jgi:hypothetical protein
MALMDEEGATTIKGSTLRAFSGVKANAVCNARCCLPGDRGLDSDDDEGVDGEDDEDVVNKDVADEEDEDDEDDDGEEPARAGGTDGRRGE